MVGESAFDRLGEIINKEKKPESVVSPIEEDTFTEQSVELVDVRREEELGNLKIVKFKDLIQRVGLKILVKGRPGTGKTRFGLTAPYPKFFIDTEFAVGAFRGASYVEENNLDTVNLFELNEKTKQMDSIKIVKLLDDVLFHLHTTGKNSYKTVCFDSLTALWKYLQDWLRYEVVKSGGNINMKNVPSDRRDWSKANSKYFALMQTLISGNWNVVATVQEQPSYDDRGNLVGYKPSMQKDTEFYFDIILRMQKVDLANGGVSYIATIEKCRYPIPITGKTLENPSFESLQKLINSSYEQIKMGV